MPKQNWTHLDINHIDFADSKTWDLLQQGETDGVFQLESAGMKEVCRRVKPMCMDDLVDILALYRTDTMPFLELYIKRKNGEMPITYIHPDLEPILGQTYGVYVYQEQVMKVAQVFAGFSDGEQDDLRKGLGKKDKDKVRAEAEKFRVRCIEKGYSKSVADKLTKQLEQMGGYLFNKGHSAGYAILSFKTAYLKANYPMQFMCSLITHQKKENGSTNYQKVGYYVFKSREMGIPVKNPHINLSDKGFTVNKDGSILFGLSLVKDVGEIAVEVIQKLRPFNSFYDFLERTEEQSSITKTVVVALIKSGCFDFTGNTRSFLLHDYGGYRFRKCKEEIKPIKNVNKTHIQKMLDAGKLLPGEEADKERCLKLWNVWRRDLSEQAWIEEYMKGDETKWEYETLNYHLLGNPFADVNLPAWSSYNDEDTALIGGTVIKISKTKIKRGKQIGKEMAFISLETMEGVQEVTVFADKWEHHRDKLDKGSMVVIRGKKQGDSIIFGGCKTLKQYKIDGK